MRLLVWFPMLILTGWVLSGCAGGKKLEEMPPEEAYRYLARKFEQGKYLDAAQGLDFFTLNYSGSSQVDSAQMLLGRAHYEMEEYLVAASAFEELTRRFPNSRLAPDAMFMVGQCYWKLSPVYHLDQEYTTRALDAMQAFIDFYPELTEKVAEAQAVIQNCRDKLAQKEYAAGMIYLKMKDFPAARIYFQTVQERYYDTPWAAESAYQTAESFQREGKDAEAAEVYRNFLAKFPNHPLADRAKQAVSETGN